MIAAFRLLLPALLPSWRFFDLIAPSPRIEFALSRYHDEPVRDWIEFRPRPDRISPKKLVVSLFWNPLWNETLYLTTCSERLLEAPDLFRETQIVNRIRDDLILAGRLEASHQFVRFRLVLVQRFEDSLERSVAFTSEVHPLEPAAR